MRFPSPDHASLLADEEWTSLGPGALGPVACAVGHCTQVDPHHFVLFAQLGPSLSRGEAPLFFTRMAAVAAAPLPGWACPPGW